MLVLLTNHMNLLSKKFLSQYIMIENSRPEKSIKYIRNLFRLKKTKLHCN